MRNTLLMMAAAAVAALSFGCEENTPVQARPVPVLDSLVVAGTPDTVTVGETIVFTATGTLHQEADPDTTFENDMTALVMWESSDPAVLLPSPDGRAVAQSAGSVNVSARTPDGTASGAGVVSNTISITVNP